MVRVKVCGLTNLEDARAAARLGADALGFILAPSPRRLEPAQVRDIVQGLPPLVATVGVFVNASPREVARIRRFCGLDWVQLSGEEGLEDARSLGPRVIKALKVSSQEVDWSLVPAGCALLLDTLVPGRAGGSGVCFDWGLVRDLARQRQVILAGGLNPENVGRALREVKPWALDVCSGVEFKPGRKDHAKLAEFIARAKGV